MSPTVGSTTRYPLVRIALFPVLALVWLGVFWRPLRELVALAFASDRYSHTIVIPFISAGFLYWQRKKIFAKLKFDLPSGGILFFVGLVLCWFARSSARFPATWDRLPIYVLALIVFLIASFVLCYGLQSARTNAFPLLFLVLMVPIPEFVLSKIIRALQYWTAGSVGMMFNGVGVPFHRDDLVFDLPGVRILIAEECSGIRSSIALFIFVLLAAQLSLRSKWRKLVLCLLVIPLAVAKNAIRIATLSLLAIYANRDFLSGRLHHDGGILFFLIGVAVLAGALRLLEVSERRQSGQPLFVRKS